MHLKLFSVALIMRVDLLSIFALENLLSDLELEE